MKLLTSITIAALLLMSSASFAGQWTAFSPVFEVYVHGQGDVYTTLEPSTAHVNPDDCVNTSYLRMAPSNVNKEEIYQMILTAQASGQALSLYIDGCNGSYPAVLYARIR